MSRTRGITIALLGAWLAISGFVLARSEASETNAWLVGALIFVSGLVATRYAELRYVVAVLAGFLFFATILLFRAYAGVLLHDLVLSFGIFVAAIVPATGAKRTMHVSPGPGPTTGISR